jgi:hypothetical protein
MSLNRCPHPNCERLKPATMYACRSHWFALPAAIRNAIWSAFRGHGALSPEWLKANKQAVDFWMSKETS